MIIMPGLTPEMKLYKLLQKCDKTHDIQLTECHDGALIMTCNDCPFHHVLELLEEEIARLKLDAYSY